MEIRGGEAGCARGKRSQVLLHRGLVEQVGRELVGKIAPMQLAGDHRVDGLQQGGFTDLVVAHHQVHVGIEGQVQMAKRLEVVDDDTFDRHAQSYDGQRARWRSLPAPWLASFPLWAILPSDHAALGGFVLLGTPGRVRIRLTRDNSILSRITIFADERSSTCFNSM